MSTSDVPGFDPKHGDTLAAGCWAEHSDGSLIFILGVEKGTVYFDMYDTSEDPVVYYRDAMAEKAFKEEFSWEGGGRGKSKDRWTWHDKTPFAWDRVIKAGAKPGAHVAAGDLISAAERVANSRKLRGRRVDPEEFRHMAEDERSDLGPAATAIRRGLQAALDYLDNVNRRR